MVRGAGHETECSVRVARDTSLLTYVRTYLADGEQLVVQFLGDEWARQPSVELLGARRGQ